MCVGLGMSVGDLVVTEKPIFQVIVLSMLICSPHTYHHHDQLSVKYHPSVCVRRTRRNHRPQRPARRKAESCLRRMKMMMQMDLIVMLNSR